MDDGVGARLREARAKRKIGFDELEAATKIRGRYLRAIENEEWELLPGDAYARAFVRAYADHLGLDGERLAEDYRRERGVARPAERLARLEQASQRRSPRRRPSRPRLPPRVLAVLVSATLVGVLVAIGLSSGGGDGDGDGGTSGGGDGAAAMERQQRGEEAALRAETTIRKPGVRLSLTATAEVWVCLLDGRGEALVNGQILQPGSEEGPFRSGSFTVSLGNGEVEMTVDGKQASVPETSSPVGFEVGPDGSMRELSESERPTCT